MKRLLFALFALAALLACVPVESAQAAGGRGHGGHFGHGHGFGHHRGFGGLGFIGGGFDYGWDLAELYRELLDNVPYYALHPPVYYSEPVPRTYGYSPFAYPPGVMTPEIVVESKPVTIINPYVPGAGAPDTKPASAETKTDRSASTTNSPEPLVIINPFVTPKSGVAKSGS
jgi:hypothetical protein